MSIRCLLWVCLLLPYLFHYTISSDAAVDGKTLEQRKREWRKRSKHYHDRDPTRQNRLLEKVQKAKGVYVHPIPETNTIPRYGTTTNFHSEYAEKRNSRKSQKANDSSYWHAVERWELQRFQQTGRKEEWNPYYFYLTQQERHRIENTVISFVWESLSAHDSHAKYRQYFLNMVCYLKHYQMKALVYIITANSTQYDIDKEMINSLYSHVEVMDYPYELFWQLISEKETNITLGPGRGDYASETPSFRSFGALPMLVPTLELLKLEVNTIYFDIDIAFLEDPIPYLIRGDADIIVSPETKNCKFPNSLFDAPWSKLEPNTGAMFVQSRSLTIEYIHQWLKRNIVDNLMNDQRILWLGKTDETIWTKSCDDSFDHELPIRKEQHQIKFDDKNISRPIKYCYVNEFRFFNGYMEWYCGRGRRGVSKGTFDLVMEQMASAFGDDQAPLVQRTEPYPSLFKHFHRFPDIANTSSLKHHDGNHHFFYHPTTLHVNYCNNKQQCFEESGLWLLIHSHSDSSSSFFPHSCARFDVRKSSYAKADWYAKRINGIKDLDVITKNIKDGDVVQMPPLHSLFMYKGGYYQYIPDLPTFEALGYDDFKSVKKLTHPVYQVIPYGDIIDISKVKAEIRTVADLCFDMKGGEENILNSGIVANLNHLHNAIHSTYLMIKRGIPQKMSNVSLKQVLEEEVDSARMSTAASPIAMYNSIEELQSRASILAKSYQTADRSGIVKNILSQASKILLQSYADLPTKNMVIVTILEIPLVDSQDYKDLLHNFLCSIQAYNLPIVIYLVEQNITRFQEHSELIRKLSLNQQTKEKLSNNSTAIGKRVFIIDYPFAFLWQTIAKKTKISSCTDCLHFHSLIPTFKSFGFIMMLIPIWEVLQAGFDVIYLDIDMTFLHNPLNAFFSVTTKATTNNIADVMVSVELRTCRFNSILDPGKNKVRLSEPNTGVMFIRSNGKGLTMLSRWIMKMVQEGLNNDQKALSFQEFGGHQTFDCNAVIPQWYKAYSRPKGKEFTYCYLNDLMVQNGKISQHCPENKGGTKAEYLMSLMGTYIMLNLYPSYDQFIQSCRNEWLEVNIDQVTTAISYEMWKHFRSRVDQAIEKYKPSKDENGYMIPLPPFPLLIDITQIVKDFIWLDVLPIAPTIMHANYCDHKIECLRTKGLWRSIPFELYMKQKTKTVDTFQSCDLCKAIDYKATWFGNLRWGTEFLNAQEEIFAVQNMNINDTFRIGRNKDIYLVTSEGYRAFTSGQQFLDRGFTWDQVKHIKNEYFFSFNRLFGTPLR